jgi:D-amino-acid dehydrogenase
MLRLARYSHACLKELRAETGIAYDHRARGMLALHRAPRALAAAAAELPALARLGVRARALDRNAVLGVEPGLRFAHARIAGGIHFPDDETGDAHKFTRALAGIAAQRGVAFRFATTVTRLVAEGGRITQVATDRGALTADAYVLAAGSYSPLLLGPLGIRLPVYPVKGYSATLEIANPAAGPTATLTDERYKVAITRLGNRLRAAGIAELAGYDLALRPARLRALAFVIRDLFPQAADVGGAEYWTGLRPMTPDNAPVIGATPYPNLFLNTGHGTLGWTMSNGSARVLADLLSGRKPEIDLDGLTLARYLR